MLYKSLFIFILLSFFILFSAFAAIGPPIEKQNSPHESYFSKACEYQKNNQYEKAIIFYKKAIAIKSDDYASYKNIGYCMAKIEKYDKAIQNYKKALELNSNLIMIHKNIGEIFIKKGDIEKAKIEYNKLKKTKPNEAEQLLEKIKSYQLSQQE